VSSLSLIETGITNDNRSLTMTEIMTPDMANFGGHVHGGTIMKLIDKVAYACAARYSGHYCVTLSVDHVLFKKPVEVGELVHFQACVIYVGRTSMEIGIRLIAENITDRTLRLTNTCYVTMVAMDEAIHKPTPVPELTLNTEKEKRWHKNAELRRCLRDRYRQEHEAQRQL
jgi:acyl-CoA hydrolase